MIESAPPVTIAFRIPGSWSHPKELVRQLPAGYRLTGDHLILPDRTEIEFGAGAPDDQFPGIFRQSLRNPATAEELAIVDGYTVNIFLKGPGGSLDAARTMMRAGAAIVQAGGAGVFIDNSTVAHGGSQWLDMAEDGSPDALSFAFVAIIRGRTEIYTLGMHVLGYPDIVMKRSDVEDGGFDIVDVIRYVAEGDKPVDDGHIIADLDGPRFIAHHSESDGQRAGSPHSNPFGRLKLVSKRDIAESN
jgi:hypothetical protein